ncbi:MAG: homoserine kinase [Actinomycetales bacterium]
MPASSANLGPGFDAFGLALAIRDEIDVEVVEGPTRVHIDGAGAGEVPLGEDHLVVRTIRNTLAALGASAAGLSLSCRNSIPHGRGVGSSAAAIVSGVVAVRGLLPDPGMLKDEQVLQLATDAEGHPDNAAASLFGGVVLGWMSGQRAHAVSLRPDPAVRAVAAIPDGELSTAKARAMLPATVPHADAAFVAGRAALLVEALTRHPEYLLDATDDRLHQGYRAGAMPGSAQLLRRCRQAGLAATISGAGPSVLVLGVGEDLADRVEEVATSVAPGAWSISPAGISDEGAMLHSMS